MERIAVSILAAFALTGVSCSIRPDAEIQAPTPSVRIGQNIWKVELAMTDMVRYRGLGGRDSVPEGTGMLFVFPQEREMSFYMKDCKVPIDIAFISADLYVVRTYAMLVEADPAHPAVYYNSNFPAKYALEVAGGTFARLGVKEGDKVELLGLARDAAKDAR
jgi:hypothetical protein